MEAEKEVLKDKLAGLRQRFKRELADDNLTAAYERFNVLISNLSFPVRAKSVLNYFKVETLNDLANLKLITLVQARNAGPVTVREISAKALELRIVIS